MARSSFELANVSLEDIILAELADADAQPCGDIITHLNQSLSHIGGMREHSASLSRKMDSSNFRDLPSLFTIDFDALGVKLATAGIIDPQAWEQIVCEAKQGGFRAVLHLLNTKIDKLAQRTRTLIDKIKVLADTAASHKIQHVMEENQPGNIKQAFASLYCEWARFQQVFLASSMSSTEQWYVFMGYGSLIGEPALLPNPSHGIVSGMPNGV